MSPKPMIMAGVVFVSPIVASSPSLAQDGTTTSIERGSDVAKALKEPSFQTRAERLNAKPLDWDSTIGEPKLLDQSPAAQEARAAQEAVRRARPGQSEGGAPDPHAVEEAKKFYPDDWK
jgi:hypothetical protein